MGRDAGGKEERGRKDENGVMLCGAFALLLYSHLTSPQIQQTEIPNFQYRTQVCSKFLSNLNQSLVLYIFTKF